MSEATHWVGALMARVSLSLVALLQHSYYFLLTQLQLAAGIVFHVHVQEGPLYRSRGGEVY